MFFLFLITFKDDGDDLNIVSYWLSLALAFGVYV